MHRTYKKIFLLLILSLIFTVGCTRKEAVEASFQPQNGCLDLSQWDRTQSQPLSLNGQWEFYWKKLLTYDDFSSSPQFPDLLVSVPSVWNSYTIDKNKLPGFGYATYRLKIKVKDASAALSLRINPVSTAYKLFVDDKLVASNGAVGTTSETSLPYYKPLTVHFIPPATEFNLIMQISNFTYARGGMWYETNIGTPSQIDQLNVGIIYKDAMLIGSLLIMAIFYCAIFWMYPRDRSSMFFIILCFLLIIRTSLYGDYLIERLFPFLSIHIIVCLTYLTIYWFPIVLYGMLRNIFPEHTSLKIHKVFMLYGIILSLLTLLLPIKIYTRFTYAIEGIAVIIVCLCIYSLIKAYTKKDRSAAPVLAGAIFLFSSGVFDLLYQNNIINSTLGEMSSVGMFIFMFSLSFLLSRRFADAFKNSENSTKKLIELDELKDDFLVSTSHQLQMPLNGVIHIAQSLKEGAAGTLTTDQEKNVDMIVATSKRLYHLVSDLIDFSNIQHDSIQLTLKPTNLRHIAHHMVFVFDHLKGDKSISFYNNITYHLADVHVDEERLRQILFNLLDNALKFTLKGSITIDAIEHGDFIVLSITDTGTGMCPDQLRNILSGCEVPYKGLGLKITKHLIELHGGALTLQSEEGIGTTATFTLPKAKEKAPRIYKLEHYQAYTHRRRKISLPDRSFYNILLLEEDAVNKQVFNNLLMLEGYTTKTIHSANEGIDFLSTGLRCDLVILDMMLPERSALEVLQQIRQNYSAVELPVLLLTSRQKTSELSVGFELGANDYLTKPFQAEELRARVKSLVELKKAINSAMTSQLSFLQAQIKPHFLFNALSVISYLTTADPPKAKSLILDLSDYLRTSLEFGSEDGMTTLQKELKLVKGYLSIEQERFEDKISIELDADVRGDYQIPVLCIQPIVENAVRHGIMSTLEKGKIIIRIKEGEESLDFEINDNGSGMSQDTVAKLLSRQTHNGSVGIKNIHRRLVTLYGAGLNIMSVEGEGTTVTFKIPYTKETNH